MRVELQPLHHPELKHFLELLGVRDLCVFLLAFALGKILLHSLQVLQQRATPLVARVEGIAHAFGVFPYRREKLLEQALERG